MIVVADRPPPLPHCYVCFVRLGPVGHVTRPTRRGGGHQRLYRHEISGDALINTAQFFTGTYGRLRTMEPTADGNLWLTTTNAGDKDSVANNSDERILKVTLGR